MAQDRKEYMKAYREKNREKNKEYFKEYKEKNKEKNKEYKEKYYQENKEEIKEKRRNDYENNKEIILEKQKKYNEDNKEKIKKRKKNYYENNKEIIAEKNKNYYEENKEAIKNYYEENKDIINQRKNEYTKNRRKTDYLFNLKCSVRNMIWRAMQVKNIKKSKKSEELLGISFEDFKNYLENKFEDWMNWDNYGDPVDGLFEPNKTWDIDHIIPLSSATSEEELLKLCYFENLQPLCSCQNRFIKRGK